MRKIIQDVVKHTGGLGFIDVVKVTGSGTATKIEAMDNDKTVFIKGYLTEALPDLEGTFGINSLGLLKGLLDFTNYKTDDAKFNVNRKVRGTHGEVPVEFEFVAGNGSTSTFRLAGPDTVPDQPTITNVSWDVTFVPNKSKIQELSQLASVYSEFEKLFSVKTDDGKLKFYIGDAEDESSHRVNMIFEDNVEGVLKGDLLWPTQQVLTILKLASTDPVTMSLSVRGLLKISVQSEYGLFEYFLPSRRR